MKESGQDRGQDWQSGAGAQWQQEPTRALEDCAHASRGGAVRARCPLVAQTAMELSLRLEVTEIARSAEGTALEAWASALRAQEMELALQGARLA